MENGIGEDFESIAQRIVCGYTGALPAIIPVIHQGIISKGKILVAGVAGNGNETCKLWSEFSQLDNVNPLNNKVNDNGYEIRVYSEDGKCVCHVGVSVKDGNIPDVYKIYTLAPSKYAVFNIYPAQGYDSQNKTMDEWLKSNVGKYKQRNMEGKAFSVLVYDDRYKGEKDPSSVVEIWIPIEDVAKQLEESVR